MSGTGHYGIDILIHFCSMVSINNALVFCICTYPNKLPSPGRSRLGSP